MKFENEITVKVLTSFEELTSILVNQGFSIKVEATLDDHYLTNKDPLNTSTQDLLHNYVIVRDSSSTGPMITYKYKEFNSDNSIKRQGKVELKVESVEKSISLLEALGYKEFIRIYNDVKIYEKDDIKLVATYVNNEYLCIEYSKDNESSLEGIIEEFKKFKIPYDDSNYFVNKAIIEIEKKR